MSVAIVAKATARRYLRPAWPALQRFAGSIREWRGRTAAACLVFRPGRVAACYLTPAFPWPPPNLRELSFGGLSKLTYLAETFPHSFPFCNILYVVSSVVQPDLLPIVEQARRRGLKIVLNQNGVAYPGWHGPGWEGANRPLREILALSDYVLYQSEFCKLSADRFLGEPRALWEILRNAVDTRRFASGLDGPEPGEPVLLAGGSQFQFYRLDAALLTVAELRRRNVDVRLLVAGRLSWLADPAEAARLAGRRVEELGIADRVRFLGPYTQEEAPTIFRRAHLLLHTQFNDACPSVVLEAMASGLPVVYSASGGVPELVGADAGIGVPASLDWDAVHPPDPAALADAVVAVLHDRARYARSARERAVTSFGLEGYLAEHQRVFSVLTRN